MDQSKLEGFCHRFPLKKFSPKEHVYLKAGTPLTHLFFLKNGFIRQYTISSEGKELTLHIYTPGALFPLSFGLNNIEFQDSLQAVTYGELFVIPRGKFLTFIETNPFELLALTKHLINGIEGLRKRIELVSFSNAQTRVMMALVYLAHHFGKENNGIVIIENHFTHEDIAALTGLTRERVSIEMGRLKEKKCITYNTKSIQLLKKLSIE